MARNAPAQSATSIILAILPTANPAGSRAASPIIFPIYTQPIYSDPYK